MVRRTKVAAALGSSMLALAACTPDVFLGTSSGMGGGGASSTSSIPDTSSSAAETTGATSSVSVTTGATTSTSVTSSAASTSASSTGSLMTIGFCGDGTVDSGEQCDDGNMDSDDGCSGACALEGLTCQTPIDRSIPPGETTIVGSTANGINSPNLNGCANAPGAERWFLLTPTEAGFLTVWTDPTGTPIDAVVYATPGCADGPTACGNNVPGAPDVISFKVTANSDVLVAIDGATNGPFKLKIDLSSGDNCTDPIPLPIGPAGSLPTSVIADTTGQASDNSSGAPPSGCGGMSAPDIVYQLLPMGVANVTVQAVGSASMAPIVYNRTTCTDQITGMCGGTMSMGGTATYSFSVGPSPTFLWVDGYLGAVGQVNLTVDP